MKNIQNQKVPFFKDKTINLIAEEAWDASKIIIPILKEEIARILNLPKLEISLEKPKDKTKGDYSTNIALQQTKSGNPKELAEKYVALLNNDARLQNYIQTVAVAGPGFINLYLNPQFVFTQFENQFTRNVYKLDLLAGKKIMFEYAHPNPFKAFHIGHLRNIILGESLIRILESLGAEIIRTNYQGDVGMHIAKCLWAFQKIDPASYPTSSSERVALIAKCYAEGANAFKDPQHEAEIKAINQKIYSKEDPKINALWDLGKKWSLDKFHELYERVDSTFVREYMESETLENCMKFIAEAKAKGILVDSDGAVVFKGEPYGLDTRVFLNAQGLPTYEGKELGLAHMEFKDYGNIDLCIHNVAVEQISFFKVTFKVEALLDPKTYEGKQYHNAYEFVGLKSGKMSSRTGNVILGEDIINTAVAKVSKIIEAKDGLQDVEKQNISEVTGVGAIKYSFLNINPGSYLAFDLDTSLNFEGKSGPYIQYTYSRANKIVSDAGSGLDELDSQAVDLVDDVELRLMKYIIDYPNIIIEAGKNLAPNIIATYLYELASEYNSFYKTHTILKESNKALKVIRIQLSQAVKDVIADGLKKLGIKVLLKM